MTTSYRAGADQTAPIRAGILTRVSTGQQVDKVSLPEQERRCREKAVALARDAARPVVIVDVYSDRGISGDGQSTRPALDSALEAIETGAIDLLLAYDLDRLSRNLEQQQAILRRVTEADGRLDFVVTPMEWTQDGELEESSALLYGVKGIGAFLEWLTTKRRTQAGRIANVEKGLQTQRGHDPYGYHIWQRWEAKAGRCSPEDVGRYVIIPEQAAVVKRIFQMAADGAANCAICRALMAENIPAPGHPGKPCLTWYTARVSDIVGNTLYRGEAVFGKTKYKKDKKRELRGLKERYYVNIDPSRWRIIPAPAIVDAELWEAANARRAERGLNLPGDLELRYLWSGILKCPTCGSGMAGYKASMGPKRNGRVYQYYRCARGCFDQYRATEERKCPAGAHYWPLATIEAKASEALAAVVDRSDFVESAVQDYLRAAMEQASASTLHRERDRLTAEISTARRRLSALQQSLVLCIESEGDTDELVKQNAQWTTRLKAAEAALSALPQAQKAADVLPSPPEAARLVRSMIARIPEVLAAPAEVISVEERRVALYSVVREALPVIEVLDGPTKRGKERKRPRHVLTGVEVTLRPECLSPVSLLPVSHAGLSYRARDPKTGYPYTLAIRAMIDGSVSVRVVGHPAPPVVSPDSERERVATNA